MVESIETTQNSMGVYGWQFHPDDREVLRMCRNDNTIRKKTLYEAIPGTCTTVQTFSFLTTAQRSYCFQLFRPHSESALIRQPFRKWLTFHIQSYCGPFIAID
ncbi:hypothetical protein AVEN_102887-1 [Araneus ventricosus]|uniref:Uncharacterized protein n=1 Tax=Araneus ventricosus TaxID=182803 RepID=A0A4Y2LYI4_ARAVE|nr:hypothetical protein AVEN_102887-1 [Araneus ventricosus]